MTLLAPRLRRSRAFGVRFAPAPAGPPPAPSRPLVQVGDGRLSRRHPCRHANRRSVTWSRVAPLPSGRCSGSVSPQASVGGETGRLYLMRKVATLRFACV